MPLGQWGIRDSLCISMIYCCPGPFSSISDHLIFSPHTKRAALIAAPTWFFFCSTRWKNIQWSLKGEQPLKKTEHEPVPRSQGILTQGGVRGHGSHSPENIVVPRTGAGALDSSFPLYYISRASLSIAFIHSWL